MILVYCPKITSRVKYTMGLFFEVLLGVPWEITTSAEVFSGFEGARLNYSQGPVSGKEVFVHSSGFLEKRGVTPELPDFEMQAGLPALFPSKGNDCSLGFDLFAAAFYLVSRYEEYLPGNLDQHGRFMAEKSMAFRNGFLEMPLVNRYAIKISELLKKRFPSLIFNREAYVFYPSYDIDVAYAYKGRGFFRGVGASLRSVFQLNFSEVWERMQVIRGKLADPFDTYELQLQWQKKYGLKAFYFFLCGEYGPFDRNISVFSTVFQNLVKTIGDYAYTGIHPSYGSHEDPARLSTEVARLSGILNREIRFSRQHYLKMKLPETYRNLIRHNINHDFSMGYATHTGFRASIASPFFFYDLGREEITSLKLFPFAVMDGTLRDYMNLSPEESVKKIAALVKAVREVDGTFMSLWHNDSLCECGRWAGWRQVYEKLLHLADPKSGTL